MRAAPSRLATGVLQIFGILTGASVLLFGVGALGNQSTEYWYLLWNLFLSWIPLILSLALLWCLARWSWSRWTCIGLTVLWLMFLPNTFYMITDYVHIGDVVRTDIIFDTLMFSMIVFTSVAMGLTSLGLVHGELARRMPARGAWAIIFAILFALSFAVYMGRELRWNTWDLVLNPTGMLFDLSEIVLKPFAYPSMFVITSSFFVALSTLYYCAWRGSRLLARNP